MAKVWVEFSWMFHNWPFNHKTNYTMLDLFHIGSSFEQYFGISVEICLNYWGFKLNVSLHFQKKSYRPLLSQIGKLSNYSWNFQLDNKAKTSQIYEKWEYFWQGFIEPSNWIFSNFSIISIVSISNHCCLFMEWASPNRGTGYWIRYNHLRDMTETLSFQQPLFLQLKRIVKNDIWESDVVFTWKSFYIFSTVVILIL